MRVLGYVRGVVLVVASVLVSLPSSHAVLFKSTANPTYNTNAPGGTLANSGWQYEGSWIGFLGTPIAPTFFLAAKHVGGAVGQTFVLNGFVYHTTAFFDDTNSDLRVWQVAETFPSYAPLYTNANEAGKHCVLFGRGTQRGTAVIVSGVTNGWQWGTGDGVKRWGENDVASIVTGGAGQGDFLFAKFDRGAASNECHLSVGDSSGAAFIQNGGVWQLAGINYAVDGPFSNAVDGTMFEAALLDRGGLYQETSPGVWTFNTNTAQDNPSGFYSTRVSSHISWINSVINVAPLPPVASFNATPTSGTSPLTVTFTDTSTGTLTNRFWNFGDGKTTNTLANILTHTYQTAGSFSVTLIVSGPSGTSTNTQSNLIVVTSPPHLNVVPSNLNFGSVTVGFTNMLAFTVANTGDQLLTGTASVGGGPFLINSGSALNIGAGQTQMVTVSFLPVSAGTFNSAVVFNSNGGVSTNAVTGTGLTPGQLHVNPASLNFGMVATGATTQGVFVVSNIGGTMVSNGTANATGGPFTILSGNAFSLAGGASTNVVVRFAPVSSGTFTSAVVFSSANGGSATNPVSGTGVIAPVASFTGTPTSGPVPLDVTFADNSTGTITNRTWNFGDGIISNALNTSVTHRYNVAGTNTVSLTVVGTVGVSTLIRTNYITALNPPLLAVNPSSRDFGALTVGQSATQTFQVVNVGGFPLTGTAASSAPFAVSGGSPYNLSAGQTGVVAVSFTASSAGAFSNKVVFTSDGGTSTNSVTGVGLTPGQIAVTPTNVDFGIVLTGTTAQATLVVTNTGGGTVSNGTAMVSPPFSIMSGGSFTLSGNGSANVVVRFAPTGTGTFNSSVVLNSANGGSAAASVTGVGATVPVANFTGNPTNATTLFAVTFTDTSTGTITNRFWSFGDGATTNTSATSVMHLYTVPGTYAVSLTVSGPVGADSTTRNNYIVVRDDVEPSVPSGLTATAVSSEQIDLNWNPSVDGGGSGLAGYRVLRDSAPIGSTTSTDFSDTGLSAGTEHCYQVAAYDNGGNTSAWSGAVCATTQVGPGALMGAYYGLITHTNPPSSDASGMVNITIKDSGSFKGTLTLDGVKSKLVGQFADDGLWNGSVERKNASPLTVILSLDLTNHTDQIRGTVSDGSFTSELLANRMVFGKANSPPPSWVGSYTVVLIANTNNPTLLPQGDGYGSVIVDAKGNVRVRGALADGTRLSQRAPLSKYGTWPLYVSLYSRQGAICGWVAFTNVVGVSDCDGALDWVKPAEPTAKYNPNGFVTEISLVGSKYVIPATGQRMLNLSNTTGNAKVIFGEGDLPSTEMNTVTVDEANKVTVVSGDSTKLTLKIKTKTGVFSGKFVHPATGGSAKFNGVVLQIQNMGSGFFLGPQQSGYVTFEPETP